jgi:hypothetical protein
MFGRNQTYEKYEHRLQRTTSVKRAEREIGETVYAAIVGAVVGAIAGFQGAIVGAVFGAGVGALAGLVGNREEIRADNRTRRLDRDIGISGGSMGTLWVRHMPARIGAFSAGSAGGVRPSQPPAEGPIPEDGVNSM